MWYMTVNTLHLCVCFCVHGFTHFSKSKKFLKMCVSERGEGGAKGRGGVSSRLGVGGGGVE